MLTVKVPTPFAASCEFAASDKVNEVTENPFDVVDNCPLDALTDVAPAPNPKTKELLEPVVPVVE